MIIGWFLPEFLKNFHSLTFLEAPAAGVADEVRKLAERASNSTKEINKHVFINQVFNMPFV